MRILVVQESDWLRRNPHQQHHMLERLSAQGHAVLVVDYPIRWRDEGAGWLAPRRVHRHVAKVVPGADVTVVRTAMLRVGGPGKLTWLATNALELARAFRAFRPDVAVILGLSNGLVALRLARLAGVPVVVHLIDALHTLAEPRALRPLAARVEHAILRGADRVVVINKALGAYATQMGAAAERIVRIPTGADTARFGPHVDGMAVRTEYGIGPHERVLLFVGWLYPFCGLDDVAAALAAATSDATAGWRLLVAGEGDLRPELERLRDTRLGERLILAGQQPAARMPAFMAAADLCLLPAQVNETMEHIVPAKVYDYLAAGKPVLASPLPGLQREFDSRYSPHAGIRYVSDASDLLAEAAALFADPALLTRAGAEARQTAVANGTWDDVTARFCEILTDVVGARAACDCGRMANDGHCGARVGGDASAPKDPSRPQSASFAMRPQSQALPFPSFAMRSQSQALPFPPSQGWRP